MLKYILPLLLLISTGCDSRQSAPPLPDCWEITYEGEKWKTCKKARITKGLLCFEDVVTGLIVCTPVTSTTFKQLPPGD